MSKKSVVIGVLAGVAAGAILGVLFAPDKGSVTRKKIKDQTGKLTNSLGETLNEFADNLSVSEEDLKHTSARSKAAHAAHNGHRS